MFPFKKPMLYSEKGPFDHAMREMKSMLEDYKTEAGKIDLLNFFISALKIDIWGEGLCGIIPCVPKGKENPPEFRGRLPILDRFITERRQVLFRENTVITTTRRHEKLKAALGDIRHEGFQQSKGNYTGRFYPELKLIIIGNGMHHSSVARLLGQGSATVAVISLADSFAEVSTDGVYWHDSGAAIGEMPTKVEDARFALLYELARLRHDLEKTQAEKLIPTEEERAHAQNIAAARSTLVRSICSSVNLAGIPATAEEVRDVLDDVSAPRLTPSETAAVLNLRGAWDFLLGSLERTLDLDFVRELHVRVGNGIFSSLGTFCKPAPDPLRRCSQVEPTDTDPHVWEFMEKTMISDPTIRSTTLLRWLLQTNLFPDGNQRVAFLVANHQMLKSGCGVIRVPSKLVSTFETLLSQLHETHNGAELEEFIFQLCIDGTGFTPYPPRKAE